jgi:hypothetical protein
MPEDQAEFERSFVTVEEIERRKNAAVVALLELVRHSAAMIGDVELYAGEAQKVMRDLEVAGGGGA